MEKSEEIDILLVEDNPQDAELTLRILSKHHPGKRIVHVEDGVGALDVLCGRGDCAGLSQQPPPRVVFLDLKLPRVDGFEVLRTVKNDAQTRTTPIVVFTSSREDSDIHSAYALGANSYVVKPVNYDEFQDTVHRLGRYWLQLNQEPA
jgi:two-component system response regulator